MSLFSLVFTPQAVSHPAEDWLYIGDKVRCVSFRVDADKLGEKGVFVPGQRSGFILLHKDRFLYQVPRPLTLRTSRMRMAF
jgi:hypothetical protein